MESVDSFKQKSKFVQLHLYVRKKHHVLRKQATDKENKVDGDDLWNAHTNSISMILSFFLKLWQLGPSNTFKLHETFCCTNEHGFLFRDKSKRTMPEIGTKVLMIKLNFSEKWSAVKHKCNIFTQITLKSSTRVTSFPCFIILIEFMLELLHWMVCCGHFSSF